MFQPDPQLATMQSYYFKTTIFSSTASAANSIDTLLLITLFSIIVDKSTKQRVCLHTKFCFPSLLKLAY